MSPILLSAKASTSLETLSNACFQSINVRYSGEVVSSQSSWIRLIMCMWSPVDFPFLNPYCLFLSLGSSTEASLTCNSLAKILYEVFKRAIGLKFSGREAFPFLKMDTTKA